MIFCVQGRVTEAPKPPQTQPSRRNFMMAVDCETRDEARLVVERELRANHLSFITIARVYEVKGKTGDHAIDSIVEIAKREGAGFALYR
jgi:hypothetical protein